MVVGDVCVVVGEVCVCGGRGCVCGGRGCVCEGVIPSRTLGVLQQARCRASGDSLLQRQAGVISLPPWGSIKLGETQQSDRDREVDSTRPCVRSFYKPPVCLMAGGSVT